MCRHEPLCYGLVFLVQQIARLRILDSGQRLPGLHRPGQGRLGLLGRRGLWLWRGCRGAGATLWGRPSPPLGKLFDAGGGTSRELPLLLHLERLANQLKGGWEGEAVIKSSEEDCEQGGDAKWRTTMAEGRMRLSSEPCNTRRADANRGWKISIERQSCRSPGGGVVGVVETVPKLGLEKRRGKYGTRTD